MNCQQTWRPNLWKKIFGTAASVSSSFETFMEWTQDAALLYFAGASISLSSCHANNSLGKATQFYLTYLQFLVLFVEEIQKRILSPNICFQKLALKKDIRAQNDLCVDQLETSTPPSAGKARAFELLKIGSLKFPPSRAKRVFKCPTQSCNLSVRGRRRLLSPFMKLVYKHANTRLVTLYMIMPFTKAKLYYWNYQK